ncbi:MAG: SIR2 family protein [Rhodoglobus sp.]
MIHKPGCVDSAIDAYALALAGDGLLGKLVIYAGAGLSFAEPTLLPNGSQLAELVYARLLPAYPGLFIVRSNDLVAISDAVSVWPGGDSALRQAFVAVARFTTAAPSYGHQAIALLLLEGVLDVLTTNWDDDIERGYTPERVQAAVYQQDIYDLAGPKVLKIHGCATRPGSLLFTSTHLAHPPAWVVDQTRALLGGKVVAFVGIGDVAGYVKTRVAEAISEVNALANIRVVSPSIVSRWSTSQWASVAPNLAPDHRIPVSSDTFMERLSNAYLYLCFEEMKQGVNGDPVASDFMNKSIHAIYRHDSVRILRWARQSTVIAAQGKSVLRTEAAAMAVLALGKLAADDIKLSADGSLMTTEGRIDILIASGIQSSNSLMREAQNRLEKVRSEGSEIPRFLTSGGMGWPDNPELLPNDILNDGTDDDDVMDGPTNSRPLILRAETV